MDNQRLAIQLQMVPELVRTFNERNPASAMKQVTNLRTPCKSDDDVNRSKTMFSDVHALLHTVLTVPVTTATAERTISTLRGLKTLKVEYDSQD